MLVRIMRVIVFTLLIVTVFSISVFARIRHVPDEYSTIQGGINDCSEGDTLLVQPGIYYESINFNGQNLVLASTYLTTGDYSNVLSTKLDGGDIERVITIENGEDYRSVIYGFTIQHGRSDTGAGITCYQSNPIISNNIIKENTGYLYGGGGLGGGIACYSDDPKIVNNVIIYNTVSGNYGGDGAGIFCSNSDAVIMNNTISYNHANRWGGGIRCYSSSPLITNTIFWGNSANDGGSQIYDGTPIVTYCDIYAGWNGEGNINANPEFRDLDNDDFRISSIACGDQYDSPCMDAGHPDILDLILDCQYGQGTVLSDMGAYGGSAVGWTDIDEYGNYPVTPEYFQLSQNYPNPFNPVTTITFSIPYQQLVNIKIYDLLGCEIKTVLNKQKQAGVHRVNFDGTGLATGVYFYRLQTDDYTQSKKMVLIK